MKGGSVTSNTLHEPLKRLIESGVATPSFVFEKGIEIDEVPETYQEFSNHDILKPYIRFGNSGSSGNGYSN